MEKMNLPLQQFLTLVGPAQALEIIEEDDTEPVFTGKAAKIRDHDYGKRIFEDADRAGSNKDRKRQRNIICRVPRRRKRDSAGVSGR